MSPKRHNYLIDSLIINFKSSYFYTENKEFMKNKLFLSICLVLFISKPSYSDSIVVENNVINLTQTPCQFLESENKNHNFKASSKSDCENLNNKTKPFRKTKSLVLKEGQYTFKVTNKNIPYEVGFYLRGKGSFNWFYLPKVSGGGLFKGVTKEYTINLKEGEYVYSCPLNPTLDYQLTVKK
jgi:hypothetical protein